VTNKNKKRRAASGYREPSREARSSVAAPERRPGLLGSIFAPRAAGPSSVLRMRSSFVRGVAAVMSSPVLVSAISAWLLGGWFVLVAMGFQGPFAFLVGAFALPPFGTSVDLSLSVALFGPRAGQLGVFAFMFVRSLLLAFETAVVVDQLELGRLSPSVWIRALRAFPTALAVNMVALALLFVTSFIVPLLGGGLGLLIELGALVLGVYFFAAATVISVSEGRRMPECMQRSIRSARLPGSNNLTFAILYVVPTLAVLVAPGKPGNQIGVNPTVGAWVLVLVVNLLHAAMLAAIAYRYLMVAQEVPEGPPTRARAR
jgi:hypothetical protein